MLTPVRRASIRAQSVPMGPLSVRLERPRQYQWHGAQKEEVVRLFGCAREKSKDAGKEEAEWCC